MKPQNFEETIVWYHITGTYVLYALGLQYVTGPAMAWLLVAYLLLKLRYQTDDTPQSEKISIPWGVWVWIAGMTMMAIALIVGFINWELGAKPMMRELFTIFTRTWALMALFPLVGCLKIRPQLIYRAACILCLQSIIFIIIGNIAHLAHLPSNLYTSPFAKFNGGAASSAVNLYLDDGEFRLYLFAPFAPALGVLGNVYFWLTCYESNQKWRWLGIIGAIGMVWFSASRTGRICLIVIPLAIWFLAHVRRPVVQLGAAVGSFLLGIFLHPLLLYIKDTNTSISKERADSTKTREVLKRIALRRWREEAPIWGHGQVDLGGRLVRNKGIGSHGTWHGVLFVHGLVGLFALAIPMACTAIDLFIKLNHSKTARAGLGILLALVVYGFTEGIEGQAYLYWPGLLIMGSALKEKIPDFQSYLPSTQGELVS